MKKKNIIFLIMLIITLLSLAYALPIVCFENDTFYSIKIGEYIVKHGIDMIDHFSWIPNLAYTYPHWLSDTIIYLVHHLFGNFGVYVFVLSMFFALLSLMYYVCKKISGKNYLAFLTVVFLGISLGDYATARAQIFSYPLLLLILYSINKLRESNNRKYLILLFVSSLLIANVHVAVWPFVTVLFLPYIVSDIVYLITNKFKYNVSDHFNIEVEKSSLKLTLLALLICLSTGFMTPNFLVPFTYYINTARGISLSNINEHLPITIEGFPHVFIMLLFVVIVLLHKNKKIFSDVLLLSGLFLLSFLSRRNYYLLSILGCLPIIRMLKDINFVYLEYVLSHIVFRIILISLMISLVIVFYNRKKDDPFIKDEYPIEAVNYIKENLDVDNIKLFNEYNYGSYLILNDIKVFIDSRADLYLEEFNKDCHIFEDFINIDKNYNIIFEKYGATHVLISNGNRVNGYLRNDSNYKELYKDDHFSLYEILQY